MRESNQRLNGKEAKAKNSPNLRRQPRQPASALCFITTSRFQTAVSLDNVSASGARIECRNGLLPSLRAPVHLSWPDGTASLARVAWIDMQHFGIEFTDLVPDVPNRCDSASLGSASYVDLIRLQKAASRQRGNARSYPNADFRV